MFVETLLDSPIFSLATPDIAHVREMHMPPEGNSAGSVEVFELSSTGPTVNSNKRQCYEFVLSGDQFLWLMRNSSQILQNLCLIKLAPGLHEDSSTAICP